MAGTVPASAAGGDLFGQLDTDGSGTISRAEFEKALGNMTVQTVAAGQVGGACSSGSLAVYAAPAAPASASVILPVYEPAPAGTTVAQMTSVAPMGTTSSLTAGSGLRHNVQYEAAEFEPEYIERVVEVPRVRVDHVEKIVEVPEVQMVDRIVEIPMVQDVLEMNDDSYARYGGGGACGGGCGGGAPYDFGRRPYDLGSSTGKYPYWGDEGQGGAGAGGGAAAGMYGGKGNSKGGRGRGNLPVKLITREVPKVEVRQVERVVEVPNIEYADRLVEVKEVREVVRRVPRVEVREIPIERIIQVPKKIIQEIEKPVYRPVPHLVKQQVEKEIPIPKHYIQTVEVVKQVAVPTTESGDVIPYNSLVDSSPAPTAGRNDGAIVHPPVVTNQYTLPAQVASVGQAQTVPASPPSMQFPGALAGPVSSMGSVSCAAGGDVFSQMDKDGSGTISRAEFEQALGSMHNQSMVAVSIAPQSMQPVSAFPQAFPSSAQSMVGTVPAMQSMRMGQQASMIPGNPTPPMPPPGSAVMMPQSPLAGTLITPQSGMQASQLFGGALAAQSPPGTRTGYMTPPTPPLGSRTVVSAAPASIVQGTMFMPSQAMLSGVVAS